MAYENNVYEFPTGNRQQTASVEQESEQPQFLPADVGAETLDSYMNFRQSRTETEDAFHATDYESVGLVLQRLWPVFVSEGEAGIYAKLQEIHETLATGKSFERGDITIEPADDGTITFAMKLVKLAREEKTEFLKWKDAPETVEAKPVATERAAEQTTFPTNADPIGQCEVAVEYLYLHPQKNSGTQDLITALNTVYTLRPLLVSSNEKLSKLLVRIIETVDAEKGFSENGVTLTPDAIPELEAAFQLTTFIDKNQQDLKNWYEQWFYPTTEVGRMEVATEYLYLQTSNEAARAQFVQGLDITTRLRPVFDSISGYTTSEAINKILETLEAGNNFERAGVLLTADDLPALQIAYEMALFEEDKQGLLRDWYEKNMQEQQSLNSSLLRKENLGAQKSVIDKTENMPANETIVETDFPQPANNETLYTDDAVIVNDGWNNENEAVQYEADQSEVVAELIPTTDQAHDLERFIDFATQTKGDEYPGLKDLLAQMKPIFENVGTTPLVDLFERIQTQLESGDAFEFAGVRITPDQKALLENALSLLSLVAAEKDDFEAWKKTNPDSEEEEEGAAEVVGEQLFGAVAGIAAENALTETWKNQTRHFSEEMSKLQKEVITRRLDGLPHIFPPDFESIVGQFIYRLNRVTEFKPTMIAEFESEFTELLAYFDLRMLRTAGEELDKELPDEPESLERVGKSLDTIDEQITNLMLLQTSQGLIRELRNVKYRLDLLRGKINRAIIAVENAEEDQDQHLAA